MKASFLPQPCRSLILLVSTVLLLTLALSELQAQAERPARGNRNRGNRMDPAQFQERRVARLKEQLEVTKDDEWSVILPRVEKVMQAQRELRMGGMGGMGRGGPGGGTNNPDDNANGGRARGNAGAGNEDNASNPDATALRKAVESKAAAAELKAHIAKMRETLKKREAALAAAQDELRKVLTTRQEAIAILLGLLH